VSEARSQLTMTVDKVGAETVLSLRGDLDIYTASRLREQLLDLVNDARPNLVIDLAELFFVDSTGLGTLVDGMKRVRQAGGSMTLRSPNASTRRAIEVSGLARILPIRD
jgi:anti-sigma B factor antagonist